MRISFTKGALEKLPKPTEGWTYYYDSKEPGLAIRVGASDIRTFEFYKKVPRWVERDGVKVKAGGVPRRLKLGRFPDMTVEQARGEAAKLRGEISEKVDPVARRRAPRGELTLEELLESYLERKAKKIRRPDKHRQTFRLYLSHWTNRRLTQITFEEVERWHRQLPVEIAKARRALGLLRQKAAAKHKRFVITGGRKTTPTDGKVSANIALKLLRALYAEALTRKLYRGDNPAIGVDKFPERSRERFLQKGELSRFFGAVAEEPDAAQRDYFVLALLTGARRENLLAMRWADVDLDRAEWVIPETKTGEPYRIPLTAEAVNILRERRKQVPVFTEWVFPGIGETGHLRDPKKAWRRVLERAEITDLRFHDLRRSLGSWMAKQGASLLIIGKSLGHKNAASTHVYARLDVDPVRESMAKATTAMLAAGGVGKSADVKEMGRRQRKRKAA